MERRTNLAKQISPELVQQYIKLDAKLDKLTQEYDALKAELRLSHSRGYESPLINFKESTSFKPNWKLLVTELVTKFMKPAERRVFFSRLQKRFPRKPVAPTIVIVGKERKSHVNITAE